MSWAWNAQALTAGKAGHADLEKALDMRGIGSSRRVTEADFRIGTHRDQAFEECDCPGLRHATLEGAVESRGNVQSYESASWNGGEQACVLIR